MHTFLQAVILGLLTGGVFALMASGQTLIFGVMKVVNLAQGALVIVGAFLSYTLLAQAHIDPFLSILITTPLMFGLGVLVQRVFLHPLNPRDRAEMSLLITFAVALGLEGVLSLVYSQNYRSIQPGYADKAFVVAGFHIGATRLFGFGLSLAMLAALWLLLARTKFGRAIRATVQNPVSAQLLGVDSARVAAYGFGLGAATAAAAGSVYGMAYPFNPNSHYDLISVLLSIIVLGGLGSIGGAIVAALIMGVASSLVAVFWSPVWSSFSFFVVLLAVLLLRPRGLFGMTLRGAA